VLFFAHLTNNQGRPVRVKYDAQMHHGQTWGKQNNRKFSGNKGEMYKFLKNSGGNL